MALKVEGREDGDSTLNVQDGLDNGAAVEKHDRWATEHQFLWFLFVFVQIDIKIPDCFLASLAALSIWEWGLH